jgi:hypothetical protein
LPADGTGTITLTTLTQGSYTGITATSASGCISNIGTATLSDPSSPVTTAGTLGAVCSGNTLSLTANTVVGASYAWTGPNGFVSALQNPTVSGAVSADSGTYTLTITLAGCTGNSSIDGVVNPTPVLVITNPAAVCAPGTVDITAAAVTSGSTAGQTYSYYTDAAATLPLASPNAVVASGTYYIVGVLASGCSDTASVVVTINPKP